METPLGRSHLVRTGDERQRARHLGADGAVKGRATRRAPLEVRWLRRELVESRHRVHAVVADEAGAVLERWGDESLACVARSAAKPLQTLPLVADGAADHFGLTDEEIALCCGSHNSEEVHIEAARSILAKVGMAEERLACGGHPPLLEARRDELVAAGRKPTPVMSNCSGKHAGMLALATFHGWPVAGYERLGHPVQERIGRELAAWLGRRSSELQWAVDGCGAPTFAAPLRNLAAAAARLAAGGGGADAPGRVVGAMTAHPYMVGGADRLCTRLMEAEERRLFVKEGAEAVYLAGNVSRGVGVALKVEDGSVRAADPALLRVLGSAGLLSSAARRALREDLGPTLRNTLSEVVGRVVVEEVA